MNYERPELLDRLAAEYVLGTLRGRARSRFERLVARSALARRALYRWEDDWLVLSRALPPVEPSPRVWANVLQRLFGGVVAAPRATRSRLWQLAAAAGLVAAAIIVGLLVRQAQPPLQTFAVLGTDSAHPLWELERPRTLTQLTVRVVGTVQRPPGKDYELWALPRGGQPVSLGVLPPTGTLEHSLTDAQRAALRAADKVAVSVEPTGGSPTGSPTGPIIIVTGVSSPG
jgi:anti-sigma-K factor RskA